MIYIGNNNNTTFKIDGADCSIYLGNVKLYPAEEPPTPAFQGKWLATYTGGTTSSAECDSSSAITNGEITLTDLESVEIGDCVASIGNNAFDSCISLTSVIIGTGVTSIGDYAFFNCTSLVSLTIGAGVISIGEDAFRVCTGLASVNIPSGVTSIGERAFYYCTGLTSVTVNATTPPAMRGSVFEDTNDCPIYVPAESVETYKTAPYWKNYASRIQAIPT